MKQIPQRELRNNVAGVLRDVEAGGAFRVTVRGRPVADLVPTGAPRTFASTAEALAALRRHSNPTWAEELRAERDELGFLDEL
jgi:prevent-host-death family protein